MKTILSWLNNSIVLSLLITVALIADLILLGRDFELNKSDWGVWVGSIGTIGTLMGTLWLATREQARRSHSERSLALVTVAALTFRIPLIRNQLDYIGAKLISDLQHPGTTDYQSISLIMNALPIWKPEELAHLVVLRDDLAARLAFAAAQIDTVRILFNQVAEMRVYTDPLHNRLFNLSALPQINSPIEILDDCFNRCRRYMDETGFSNLTA